MRKIRICSQIFFLLVFTGLFFLFNKNPHAYSLESEAFLFLNPLSALITSIASRALIMPIVAVSIVLILMTMVMGRVFCGFMCPLGSLIDFLDRFLFTKMRHEKRRPPRFFKRTKYVYMILLIVLAVLGITFPLFIDPLSTLTKIFTLVVNPVLKIIGIDLIRTVSIFFPAAGNNLYSHYPLKVPLFYGSVLTLVLVLFVFVGGFWDRRFFCQYMCPTGAFYGLVSRFALFRRKTNDMGCNSCSRCARSCPVRAIPDKDFKVTNVSECITCGICVGLKESCSSFHIGIPFRGLVSGPDLKRRHILTGAAGGLLMIPVFRATAVGKRDDHGRLVRPPGSLPEDKFLARCLTCGECMKVCPTNALQPCTFTDGLSRLYTPKVVPRIAGCEEKCSLCGYVCPTGAIRKISYEEKRFAKIGTAVLDRHRCLAWEQNKECLVCDEVCPYNAIEFRIVDTVKGKFKVPVVNQDLCLGCGLCEQHCPVFDTAAIVVYKFGENRREHGPYANEWQKKDILEKRKLSDSRNMEGNNILGGVASEPGMNGHPYSAEGSSGFSDGFLE